MKIRSILLSVAGVLGVAVALLVLSAAPLATDTQAQGLPSLEPPECMCSRGVELGTSRSAASTLHNCQCGGLQCVVHAQSGQLQCR
ncbi:MAG TPA: hypothetical protein PLF79_05540 [Thauera sp.]|uniref:hypothetical protein n=1 Tax=Thauera sp. TaxID=1905334 RepID=UPI002CBBFEF2|nr:hypothetical protein [Thauera sp.]HRP24883.1 hypothetical protein [Thauera sp.]HRP65515.1 hypothetical protein [Thauera sp.]